MRRSVAPPDLLKNADRSAKGISSPPGFSNPSHFVFCFKNKIGVTPKNSRMSSERDGLTKKSPFYRENKDLPICFLPKRLSARPFA